jgi:hypothetical protein
MKGHEINCARRMRTSMNAKESFTMNINVQGINVCVQDLRIQ